MRLFRRPEQGFTPDFALRDGEENFVRDGELAHEAALASNTLRSQAGLGKAAAKMIQIASETGFDIPIRLAEMRRNVEVTTRRHRLFRRPTAPNQFSVQAMALAWALYDERNHEHCGQEALYAEMDERAKKIEDDILSTAGQVPIRPVPEAASIRPDSRVSSPQYLPAAA